MGVVAGRHGTWAGRVALALLATSLARMAPAHAEQATPAVAPSSKPIVVLAGGDAMAAQLRELAVEVVAAEAMGKLTLASQAFRAAELARAHSALGTVWFGTDDRAQLRVYVYDAKHRQLTSRTLSRSDAAVREEVAVVLRSAISALIAGEATALDVVTIPPPAPAPAPSPPRPRRAEHRVHVLAGLGYAGTTYASGTFQHGAQLLVAARLTSRVLVGADGVWGQAAKLSGAGAEAVLDRYPVELFAGYGFADNPRFHAYVEAALQLELVRRTTRITDPRLQPEPVRDRFRFAVSPRLRSVFEPTKSWLVYAAFGADITTDRFDYVVQSASGPVRLTPRSVRPRLEAGVVFRLW